MVVDDILQVLQNSNRILITTHIRPDGDAIGSELALGRFLHRMGKDVAMINTHEVPSSLDWMPNVEAIQVFDGSLHQHGTIAAADTIVVVDTNTMHRLGSKLGPIVRNSTACKVLIDHHTEPEAWFDHVYVEERAAATGEMIYTLICHHDAGFLVHKEIATALYVALVTDTGSFQYGTVTPNVHRITAEILERGGVDPSAVYSAIYESHSLPWARLLAQVLGTLTMHFEGRLGYLVATRGMITETGCTYSDLEGFVDYAMAIEGVEVALLFSQLPHGTKVSFRSKGDRHVHKWARNFGGGGHRNASGAYLTRPLEEVISSVMEAAPRYTGLAEESDGGLSADDEAYLTTLLEST